MLSTDLFQVIESVYPNGLPFGALNWAKPQIRETTRKTIKQSWTWEKDSGMIYKLGPGTGKVRQNRNFAWMKNLKSSLPETALKPITFVMDKYIEKYV